MTNKPQNTDRARSLRVQQTKTESLLWAVLRGKQLCGLRFRRQHPIGPYFADFVCVSEHVVVEVDGGYHDRVGEADLRREAHLQELGWRVIRFTDKEVEEDAEAVARAIARQIGLEYDFKRRDGGGSGALHASAPEGPKRSVRNPGQPLGPGPSPAAKPSPAATASDPPRGRVR